MKETDNGFIIDIPEGHILIKPMWAWEMFIFGVVILGRTVYVDAQRCLDEALKVYYDQRQKIS